MEKEPSLSVTICENLPFDLTILEKEGRCQKPEANCQYNRSNLDKDLCFCYKKTCTGLPLIRSSN